MMWWRLSPERPHGKCPPTAASGYRAVSANLHLAHGPGAVEEAQDFQAQVALCGGLELEIIRLSNGNHQPRLLFDRLRWRKVRAILRHRPPAHGRSAAEQRDLEPVAVRSDVDKTQAVFHAGFQAQRLRLRAAIQENGRLQIKGATEADHHRYVRFRIECLPRPKDDE